MQVEIAGFATRGARRTSSFNAGQNAVLNFSLQLSTVQETVTVAGDAPIVQTTSSEVASTIDRTGVREPAGQGAQLLPPADARLERRRHRHRLERRQRRRRRSLELRHLRRRHEQPLEVADAAARAAARLERLRDRDGEGSAADHQPVLGRVRRPLRRRRQHDHQEPAPTVQRLGVRDDPARRPGRGAAAGADRQRREGQGAVQPAAVRRHRRRPDREGQAVLLRQLRAAPRAQRGDRHGGRGVGAGRADAGRRAPGPRQDRLPLQRAALARRPLQHGALAEGQRGRRPQPARHRLHLGQQRRHACTARSRR